MEERLEDELAKLRTWNPSSLLVDPALFDNPCPPLILPPNRTYYDKHIHDTLALKRVMVLPSLVNDLAKVMDDAEASILDHKKELPPIHYPFDSFISIGATHKEPVVDAKSVADVYESAVSDCCLSISSMFLFPNLSKWIALMNWRRAVDDRQLTGLQEDFTLQVRLHSGRVPSLPPRTVEALSGEDTEVLLRLARRFEFLATWEIFACSEESERIIKNMGSVQTFFKHEVCASAGYSPAEHPPPTTVDASSTPWSISQMQAVSAATAHSRKASLRSGGHRGAHRSAGSRSIGTMTVPSSKTQTAMARSGRSVEDFVQRGWCQAVRRDTTVIVFHCGNYERIGIRHRETQTLFLSELIDVTRCQNPAYGALHLGLYIAIFKDAVDRDICLTAAETATQSARKRRRHDDEDNQKNKRRKIVTRSSGRQSTQLERRHLSSGAPDDHDSTDMVLEYCQNRNMLFLTFKHSVYNSPSPASLIRELPALLSGKPIQPALPVPKPFNRQRKYSAHQYISLTVTSNLGHGAVGEVHGGKLEVTTAQAVTHSCDAVIKLAFSEVQQKKMRYEYSIYQHLSSLKTKGIPSVFGMFKDVVADGPLALVMSFGGTDVWHARRPDLDSRNIELSEEERNAFMKSLRSIHRAGVRHNDIRPENLLVKGNGKVTIIDFDRATLGASRGARRRERNHLGSLFTHHFYEPGTYPSSCTPPDLVSSDPGDSDDSR